MQLNGLPDNSPVAGAASRPSSQGKLIGLLVGVGALLVVLAVIATIVLVNTLTGSTSSVARGSAPAASVGTTESPEDSEAAREGDADAAPPMDGPDSPLSTTISDLSAAPGHSWQATPSSLGLGEATVFEVGKLDGFGVHLVDDMVITKYGTETSIQPDPLVVENGIPVNKPRVNGLIGLDSRTGAVRWNLDLYDHAECTLIENSASAVCEGDLRFTNEFHADDDYGDYMLVDLRDGTWTRTAFLALPSSLSIRDGRLKSVATSIVGDWRKDEDQTVVEIASGTPEDPTQDWAVRVPHSPAAEDSPCRLLGGHRPEMAGGAALSKWPTGEPFVDLQSAERFGPSDTVAPWISPTGTVLGTFTCPAAGQGYLSEKDVTWEYLRADGVALPGITGHPLEFGNKKMPRPVATVKAADLPIFTSDGAFSTTGEKLWDYPEDRFFESFAVIGDTVLLHASRNEYAIGLHSGELLWHRQNTEMVPMEDDGFVATDGERVFTRLGDALNITSGDTEWSLGPFPEAPALEGPFAKFGNTSAYTQYGNGFAIHSNEIQLIGFN